MATGIIDSSPQLSMSAFNLLNSLGVLAEFQNLT